jgi:hypothetical protein
MASMAFCTLLQPSGCARVNRIQTPAIIGAAGCSTSSSPFSSPSATQWHHVRAVLTWRSVSLCNCDVCGRKLLRWLPRHQHQQVRPSTTTNKSRTLNPYQICSLAQTIGLRGSHPPAPRRNVASHVFFGGGKGAYSLSTPQPPATSSMHSLLAGWATGGPGGGFSAPASASA